MKLGNCEIANREQICFLGVDNSIMNNSIMFGIVHINLAVEFEQK